MKRIFSLAAWHHGLVLFFLDLLVLPLLLVAAIAILNVPSEPVARCIILTTLYMLFLYAFDFYSIRQFDSERKLYAIALVIFFSVPLSVLFNYAIFFHPIGRKILLLHTVFAGIYLFLRTSFLSEAKKHVQNRFLLVGISEGDLTPAVREKLSGHGSLVSLVPGEGVPNSKPLFNDFFILEQVDRLEESDLRRFLLEKLSGKPVFTLAGFFEFFFRQVDVNLVENRFFFEASGFNRAMRRFPRTMKRVFDLILALILFFPLAPFMFLTAVAIRLESSGPALFRQTRTGLHGVPFTILKFRSMRQDAEKTGSPQWASEDDPRITRIGRIIRKLRIDELPQLINVIRGDMSFVGPRPERPEFDEKLKMQLPFYMFRYMVKPGITGWAQVNYGYGASIEDALEKLKYDLYYVKNTSLLLDVEIFLKTIATVFLAKGR